ncbi:unnamed protein product [Eruca vesicaria subsp. sativa]|uniref:Uncharacterized protein n=1 Tax=Eruca vesicaria subsp. sativa TaxID=29727 RepID=A0ABC8LRV6_ERUVS|nr:unnamed protein product [Eruca vesicaria subsp. sativa]
MIPSSEITEAAMLREVDEEEEEERIRRQKKLEEALEAKSLCRIISAYLNYPEAAEEDLKKWERSYRKLSPAHKISTGKVGKSGHEQPAGDRLVHRLSLPALPLHLDLNVILILLLLPPPPCSPPSSIYCGLLWFQGFAVSIFSVVQEWTERNEDCSLLEAIYVALDEVAKQAECEIYVYNPNPNADPFLEGAIRSFCFLFYNGKQKRVAVTWQ